MFCVICQKEKEATEFYSSNKSHCKTCIKNRAKKYREEKRDYYREYDRNRPNKTERAKNASEYKKRLRSENPEKYDSIYHKARRNYRKNHHEKCIAHDRLAYALETGKIKRPDKCSLCGVSCTPQGHHYDYSKALEVIWLCSKCHSRIHVELRKAERNNEVFR